MEKALLALQAWEEARASQRGGTPDAVQRMRQIVASANEGDTMPAKSEPSAPAKSDEIDAATTREEADSRA